MGKHRSRLPIAVLSVASLVLSGAFRHVGMDYRNRGAQAVDPTSGGGSAVGAFDSYALALLLGGLRGPLVMVLWSSSEQQKSERNLEDLDTKIEWIRLLQPEFDSVHIFQVWNKAYNISVQMASLSNKYSTVLDAIDYGYSVDRERPNDINIVETIGQTWAEKLGNSNEPDKSYYRKTVREQSKARTATAKVSRNALAGHRVEMDPILDAEGNILPQHLEPKSPPVQPVSSVLVKSEGLDGSDLQFLRPFQPFKQGVSPVAIGYNYYKRAQVLYRVGKQKHLQLSESVVDSRPAIAAKIWAEEEWERGRRFEFAAYGVKAPPADQRLDLELGDVAVAFGAAPKDARALDDAIYCYGVGVRVASASLAEYADHVARFQQDLSTHAAHQDHLRGMIALMAADRDFLAAGRATGDGRAKLAAAAVKEYQEASDLMSLTALKYYTDGAMVSRTVGMNKFSLKYDESKPFQMTNWLVKIDDEIRKSKNFQDDNSEDRDEYMKYVRRAASRQLALKAAGFGQ